MNTTINKEKEMEKYKVIDGWNHLTCPYGVKSEIANGDYELIVLNARRERICPHYKGDADGMEIKCSYEYDHSKPENPKKPSMKQQILKYLQDGGTLTPQDALSRFSCMSLHQRINELRKAGHNIKTEMIEVKTSIGTARVAKYSYTNKKEGNNVAS